MYKSKRSLKVYEAPLGLNGKQQIPRIQLQGQWLGALGYHVGDKIDVQLTNDTIIINKMKTKQTKRIPSYMRYRIGEIFCFPDI